MIFLLGVVTCDHLPLFLTDIHQSLTITTPSISLAQLLVPSLVTNGFRKPYKSPKYINWFGPSPCGTQDVEYCPADVSLSLGISANRQTTVVFLLLSSFLYNLGSFLAIRYRCYTIPTQTASIKPPTLTRGRANCSALTSFKWLDFLCA
jgi:hypothetical protein